MDARVRSDIISQVYDQVRDQVHNQVYGQVYGQALDQVHKRVRDQAWRNIPHMLENREDRHDYEAGQAG